jgi:hypothetical protein
MASRFEGGDYKPRGVSRATLIFPLHMDYGSNPDWIVGADNRPAIIGDKRRTRSYHRKP